MKTYKLLAFLAGAVLILPACSSDDDEKEPEPVDLRKEFVYCPDINHPHVIDMGEAGKWSCRNVGAINPTDYGEYYAWGETGTKTDYTRNTYKHYVDGENPPYKNIGNDIQATKYDAATEKWKSPWKMPTNEQMEKLINNCTHQWTSFDGVYGYVFTSPAGNSIFLPAGGRYNKSNNDGIKDKKGFYWTSTFSPNTEDGSYAYFFFIDETSPRMKEGNRVLGNSIRPVQ